MSIYIFGDTHGINNCSKVFDVKYNKDDTIFIAGDWGGIFFNNEEEKKLIKLYDELPCEVYIIDGNHENFEVINSLQIVSKNGANCHQISKNIYHIMRGECITISNKKFFCFGGAASIDKEYRLNRISWWEEEIPNYKEFLNGAKTIRDNNGVFDYVITHTCPEDLSDYSLNFNNLYTSKNYKDPTGGLLQELKDKITNYNKWFFGHYHKDFTKDNFVCLFNEVYKID